jgi:hypothetical protein
MWANDGHAAFFGKQYLAKGGVRNVKSFFKDFTIDNNQPTEEMMWNIYQAGLFVRYGMFGGDQKMTDALQEITTSLEDAKSFEKALVKFEKQAEQSEKSIKKYLEKLIAD